MPELNNKYREHTYKGPSTTAFLGLKLMYEKFQC